jgi:hypothetical protein
VTVRLLPQDKKKKLADSVSFFVLLHSVVFRTTDWS